MTAKPLSIPQHKPPIRQMAIQIGRGNFRGVADTGKLRFPEKNLADGDPENTAYKLRLTVPDLNRMSVSRFMKVPKCLHHAQPKPRQRRLSGSCFGARLHDSSKVLIERNIEPLLANLLTHAFLDVRILEEEDRAISRTPPFHRTKVRNGKDAALVRA